MFSPSSIRSNTTFFFFLLLLRIFRFLLKGEGWKILCCMFSIYIYGVPMHTRDDVHRVSICSVKWADGRDGKKEGRERALSTRKLKNDPPKQRERKRKKKRRHDYKGKKEKNERMNKKEDELMSQKTSQTNKRIRKKSTKKKRKSFMFVIITTIGCCKPMMDEFNKIKVHCAFTEQKEKKRNRFIFNLKKHPNYRYLMIIYSNLSSFFFLSLLIYNGNIVQIYYCDK